jgi:Ca2+-binding RTX toxin-like protein
VVVLGREGNDHIYGNPGSDRLFGNLGKDTINSVGDRGKDVVNCGAGNDTAYVDKIDRVNKNCETVFLRIR